MDKILQIKWQKFKRFLMDIFYLLNSIYGLFNMCFDYKNITYFCCKWSETFKDLNDVCYTLYDVYYPTTLLNELKLAIRAMT